ncbi:chemotaxis response regulator protein-glutamate methylesterase [bacterium]|nr:chemotaxis response regulator protein-glutamate methylesterase [bacterium]
MQATEKKKGVLVVDDSAFMRKVLSEIISSSDEFALIDTASNGEDALAKLRQHGDSVELVTLDVEMPRMDGLSCLRQMMAESPRRVVMVSSLTTEGAAETIEALEAGAIDFLAKPGGNAISLNFKESSTELLRILRSAAMSRIPARGETIRRPAPRARVETISPVRAAASAVGAASRIVAVASSTGGPKALASFIPQLPDKFRAAMLVVQHMPATFTKLLAERLDKSSAIRVKEAEEGDVLEAGTCLIAPGGFHTEVTPSLSIHLTKDPPVGGLRPCADITFRTLANAAGSHVMGVVLTGMGSDGTEGCKALRAKGAQVVLAESRQTATIWGMPRSVVEHGVADREVPIDDMAAAVVEALGRI